MWITGILLILLYLLSSAIFDARVSKEVEVVSGTVIEHDSYSDYQRIVVRNGARRVLAYYNGPKTLNLGDKVEIKGKSIPLFEQRIPFGYNEKEQLYAKQITHKMFIDTLQIYSRQWGILDVRTLLNRYLETNFSKDVQNFMQAMLLGKSYLLEDDMKASLSRSGIMHLFAVSGLHIQLFVLMFHKGLKKTNLKEKYIEIVISTFLVLYMIVTSFSSSVVRAASMYFAHIVSKKYNLMLSGLDIISIVFIVWVLINPYAVFSIGFLLSFSSATTIMLFHSYTKHLKEIKQIFLVSIVLLIVGLPLVNQFQGSINLFTPFFNVVFIPLVSKLILPLTIVILVLPRLAGVFQIVIHFFVQLLVNLDRYFYLPIPVKRFNGMELFLYYGLGFLLLAFHSIKRVKKAILITLSILLGYMIFFPSFSVLGEVTFLDLDNGEATFIRAPHNSCNMLIDTGDGKNNVLQSYLQNYNIQRLDYLVLTHRHLDHNGEAKQILASNYTYAVVTHFYDDTYYGVKTIKVKEGDRFNCGLLSFFVLHPTQNSSNENDNSIVLYAKIGKLSFLFLGDVTQEVEVKISLEHQIDVDVVKIAHHGSKTSTASELIQRYLPTYAIIMTGRVEKFDFPHQEVITTLNEYDIKTYRTDQMYSIRYYYLKDRVYWFQTLKKTA